MHDVNARAQRSLNTQTRTRTRTRTLGIEQCSKQRGVRNKLCSSCELLSCLLASIGIVVDPLTPSKRSHVKSHHPSLNRGPDLARLLHPALSRSRRCLTDFQPQFLQSFIPRPGSLTYTKLLRSVSYLVISKLRKQSYLNIGPSLRQRVIWFCGAGRS